MQVYEKDGVTLTLSCEKQSDTGLTVTLTASNSTDSDISSFTLQAAVPKVCLSTCDTTHHVLSAASKLFGSQGSLENSIFLYRFSVLYHIHRYCNMYCLSMFDQSLLLAGCQDLDPVMFSVVGCSAVNGAEQHMCVLVL